MFESLFQFLCGVECPTRVQPALDTHVFVDIGAAFHAAQAQIGFFLPRLGGGFGGGFSSGLGGRLGGGFNGAGGFCALGLLVGKNGTFGGIAGATGGTQRKHGQRQSQADQFLHKYTSFFCL